MKSYAVNVISETKNNGLFEGDNLSNFLLCIAKGYGRLEWGKYT